PSAVIWVPNLDSCSQRAVGRTLAAAIDDMSFPLTAPEMARNPAHGLKPPDSESFRRRHVKRQLQRRSTAPGCRPKLVSDPDQALPCGCHQALLFSGRSLRKPPG